MLPSELTQIIEESHQALNVFPANDPAPLQQLFSRRDDVTLANPFGPVARGWSQVEQTLERAASNYRDGEATGFERISEYATEDLAFMIEVERFRAKVGGAAEIVPFSLRVTTIFRREDGVWKIMHRHADPITASRSAASIL